MNYKETTGNTEIIFYKNSPQITQIYTDFLNKFLFDLCNLLNLWMSFIFLCVLVNYNENINKKWPLT